MSHNWIFLIYCYFGFNCPVLSFFLRAARVCGVVAVFLGAGGGPVTLNILLFFFFFKPNQPFFYTTHVFPAGCLAPLSWQERDSRSPPKNDRRIYRRGRGGDALLTASPPGRAHPALPVLGFAVSGAAAGTVPRGCEGELFCP